MSDRNRYGTWILLGITVVLLALCWGESSRVQSQPLSELAEWSTPVSLSFPGGFSWFPDLTVDPTGSVHVVWCLTIPLEGRRGLREQVAYARLRDTEWTSPNDIVPISPDIVRNAIASDARGNLHLIFGGSVYERGLSLYHQRAFMDDAWSAQAWSAPHLLNQGISYMGDIAIDTHNTIHVIYDDAIYRDDTGDAGWVVADIFYRRSDDGGAHWSRPIDIFPSPDTGSARLALEIDSRDTLHVTWDEGWDRLSGEGKPMFGGYTYSTDGGETWAPTTIITHPDSTVAQLTVGSDGQGGVILVWRTTSQDEIFYQWSSDGGRSWGEPAALPAVFARPWQTPFDMYDMATDSAGNIHLLVVGREILDRNAELGIYHLVWDGSDWSRPTKVFSAVGSFPEYPRLVVHAGNQLHAAWFTREGDIWDSTADRKVWYAEGQLDTPEQPVTLLPTFTPVPSTPTPTPYPTPTLFPTAHLGNTGLPNGLRTDHDDVLRLALALSPVVVLILGIAILRKRWGRWR